MNATIAMITRCALGQAAPTPMVKCMDCGEDLPEPYRRVPRCATCAVKRDAA